MSEPLWETLEDAIVTLLAGIDDASDYDIRGITPLEFSQVLDLERIQKPAVLVRTLRAGYNPIGVGDEPTHDVLFTFETLVVDKIRAGAVDKFRGTIATVDEDVRAALVNQQLVSTPFASSPLRPVGDEPRVYGEGFTGMARTWECRVQYNG